MRMSNDWNVAMNIEDAVDGHEDEQPLRRTTAEDITLWMESDCDREIKAHVLLDEIGEDAFIDALRSRGYSVTEEE